MIAGARNGNLQLLTFARFPEPEFLVDEEQHFGRLSGGVRRLIYLRRCSWDTHHEEKYDCDEERFSFHAMKLQCFEDRLGVPGPRKRNSKVTREPPYH